MKHNLIRLKRQALPSESRDVYIYVNASAIECIEPDGTGSRISCVNRHLPVSETPDTIFQMILGLSK